MVRIDSGHIGSIRPHNCQFLDYVGGKGKSLQGYNESIGTTRKRHDKSD